MFDFPHAAKRQVYCERHPRLIDLRDGATRMAETLERRYRLTGDTDSRRWMATSISALRNMVVCVDFAFDFAATATDEMPLQTADIDRELAALNDVLLDVTLGDFDMP
jgi:hypothetical protein